MMKFTAISVSIILLCSCAAKDESKEKERIKIEDKITTTNNFIAYKNFLSSLDSNDITTVPKAVKKYEELFTNDSFNIKDSAFILFDDYYKKVSDVLNIALENDTTNFDALIFVDEQNSPLPLPLSTKLTDFKNKIIVNGFKIASTEGTIYIKKRPNFIESKFHSFLSPIMKEYLQQINKEDREGFQEDAGIIIEPITYIDRTIWWENFILKNESFILIKEAKMNKKKLLTYLLIGMDNTPTTINEEIDIYFKNAYIYLQKNYPNSNTNKIIAPVFSALQKKDKITADKIRNNYIKQGLIIDFKNID
jgi:hypothetical protein